MAHDKPGQRAVWRERTSDSAEATEQRPPRGPGVGREKAVDEGDLLWRSVPENEPAGGS